MPSSAKLTTQELTQLGVLLAVAIVLRIAENFFPYLLPLPGARLGLANILTIFVLINYGTNKAGLFLCTRILLVGILSTGLFTPGFLIGLGGAALSFVFMSIAVERNWFSPIGIGLLGAFMHNCGQIIMAVYLLNSIAVFSYLPLLIAIGIPTGLFTGTLANILLKRIKTT
ncbi:MAG: Gx transporter family protein [Acidaminococcaceae bacterium]|nr:Gx transporter family protein [Acidaminococcaceae bacterium]MDD4722040.1 Gx transporter family protein [Acidaminococcaceae bacterium]